MFGIILITKDETFYKKIKNFCDKQEFVLLKVLSSFAQVKKELNKFFPDFLFVDENSFNNLELKSFLNAGFKTKTIVFSSRKNRSGEESETLGVQRLSRTNFSKQLLRSMSESKLCCIERKTGKVVDLKRHISTFCLEAGILPHLSGYKYVVYAILLTILDIENAKFLTKQIYPKVAKKFGVSAQIVERTIRHALIVACQNGRLSKLNELIEAEVFLPDERISNGQFISVVADRFLYKLKVLNNQIDLNLI